MPDNRNSTVLISIVSPDQLGLIAAVTGVMFDIGVNLADTSFAILGQGCEFSCVAELPDGVSQRAVQSEIQGLPCMKEADILVMPFRFQAEKTQAAKITHIIDVAGGDQPGLIARLSEVFNDYDANVVLMNSTKQENKDTKGEGQYLTCFSVSIPEQRAEGCLAAIYNTASQLQLSCVHRSL